MRGAPSRWEVLVARARAAWQRLRSLQEERAKARSKQRHPAYNRTPAHVQAEPAQTMAVALDAVVAVRPTGIHSPAAFGTPQLQRDDAILRLSQAEYVAWLAQERRDFEDHVDRKGDEYRRARDQELGL